MSTVDLTTSKSHETLKNGVGRRRSSDLVAAWEVALSDGVHKIEFEHGTTTGKRVIFVNGKVSIFFYRT